MPLSKSATPPGDREIRRRVLIVDDEPLIRWCLSETLRPYGYVVAQAADARAAVAAVGDGPFAVIALDVCLPDARDLSPLIALHKVVPDTRIILMTTPNSTVLSESALKSGAHAVLEKPFGMADFARAVHQASHDYRGRTLVM